MKTAAIIPCRYQSSRFEGKPLATIGGMPMMWHVYQQASKASSIGEVHIATDDERIAAACREHGLRYLMTSQEHVTGTDRVAECARMIDAQIIVNVQGDEPFILPESIDKVTQELIHNQRPGLAATNAFCRIEDPDEVNDPCVVKTIFSTGRLALAYSRLPIPLAFRQPHPSYRQLGLYAFHRESLEFFSKCPQGPVEKSESVEMYRFIEHDRPVLMVEVEEKGIAVDTPEDLYNARQHFNSTHPESA